MIKLSELSGAKWTAKTRRVVEGWLRAMHGVDECVTMSKRERRAELVVASRRPVCMEPSEEAGERQSKIGFPAGTTGKGEDACVHTGGSHDLQGKSAKSHAWRKRVYSL